MPAWVIDWLIFSELSHCGGPQVPAATVSEKQFLLPTPVYQALQGLKRNSCQEEYYHTEAEERNRMSVNLTEQVSCPYPVDTKVLLIHALDTKYSHWFWIFNVYR